MSKILKHFFFLFYKIKYSKSSVTNFQKKKKLQQNLDGKLLKVGKKAILIVDPHKTSYNLSLKFYCESSTKIIIFKFILAKFKKI